MATIRNYSLANHSLVFVNTNSSVIIGNGASVESITVSFENDNFSHTMSADGSATLNVNYMLNGTISVALQQTNPFVTTLDNIYKAQLNSTPIDEGTITLKDSNGNINGTFDRCVIVKYPDYTAESESSTREYTFRFTKGELA